MQKLNHPNVFSLSDAEYKIATKELLKFSDAGKYSLTEYMTVFYYVARFGNPLRIELKKLEKRIIRGMYKGIANYVYMPNGDMHFYVNDNNEFKEYLINITAEARKINEELQHIKHKKNASIVEELFHSDFDAFVKVTLGDKAEYTYTPFFEYFDVNKTYEYLLSKPTLRWDFTEYLHLRYKIGSYYYASELQFFQKLKKKIEKKSKAFGKMVFGYTLSQLNNEIEATIIILTKSTTSI